jgi:hypothetical protein
MRRQRGFRELREITGKSKSAERDSNSGSPFYLRLGRRSFPHMEGHAGLHIHKCSVSFPRDHFGFTEAVRKRDDDGALFLQNGIPGRAHPPCSSGLMEDKSVAE